MSWQQALDVVNSLHTIVALLRAVVVILALMSLAWLLRLNK